METTVRGISDYFPLCYDIAASNGMDFAKPRKVSLSAETLIEWAIKNQFTEMQTLVVLSKNAFEGYWCHLKNIPVERLVESGTMQPNPDGNEGFTELAHEFFSRPEIFQKGLEVAWQKLLSESPGAEIIDLQALQHFMLANQLFRFPVSCLKEFDSFQFIAVTKQQKETFRINYQLHFCMLNHASQFSLIEIANNMYHKKFKDVILKLKSKENVLMQLTTKLDYANDPDIETDEQLDKKYFEFQVGLRISEAERRTTTLSQAMNQIPQYKNLLLLLRPKIKKLHKLISKNCSEVHTQIDVPEPQKMLVQSFMDASAAYNNFVFDIGSLMQQYSKLFLIFVKVVNYRTINRWPVIFPDFTAIKEKQTDAINEEDVLFFQNKINTNLELLQSLNATCYKLRYVEDDEIGSIHRRYLLGQLEYLEQRITEVTDEIRHTMQSKTKAAAQL